MSVVYTRLLCNSRWDGWTLTEQRRQRQDIFAVEDEIEARRDALIAALQKRLHRASRNQSLFVVRWSVV